MASAPALGAGDREFESPRPDQSAPPGADGRPAAPTEESREDRCGDPVPDPREAQRRDPLRRPQAEPRCGVCAHREAGQHPRFPQGEGPGTGDRAALRTRGRPGGGHQRGRAEGLRRCRARGEDRPGRTPRGGCLRGQGR